MLVSVLDSVKTICVKNADTSGLKLGSQYITYQLLIEFKVTEGYHWEARAG